MQCPVFPGYKVNLVGLQRSFFNNHRVINIFNNTYKDLFRDSKYAGKITEISQALTELYWPLTEYTSVININHLKNIDLSCF